VKPNATISEVPGPNDTPLVVALAPEDRARVQSTFDQITESVAAFEASAEVSPFSSKFDDPSRPCRAVEWAAWVGWITKLWQGGHEPLNA
jgi:hypothetical protein